MFHASFISGEKFNKPVSKVVCVGRNYAEHARELNNPVPDAPILFIKPETSVIELNDSFPIPESDCHYEAELAILVGKDLKNATNEEIEKSISGIGLALDLTKRNLQSELKKNGHPWEIAKAFDGACPLSQFIPFTEISPLESLSFSLSINGETRQHGVSTDMITPIIPLLAYISQHFALRAGDVVLTGTPKGVGPLYVGDKIELSLDKKLCVGATAVASNLS